MSETIEAMSSFGHLAIGALLVNKDTVQLVNRLKGL